MCVASYPLDYLLHPTRIMNTVSRNLVGGTFHESRENEHNRPRLRPKARSIPKASTIIIRGLVGLTNTTFDPPLSPRLPRSPVHSQLDRQKGRDRY